MRSGLLQTAVRLGGIVAIGTGVGFIVNAIRADGLPLSVSPAAVARYEGAGGACTSGPATRVPEVSLDEARSLYAQPRVTFVDARGDDAFRRGHIRGALNLPYEVAAQAAGRSSLPVPRDHRLIVYCDYVNCQLSELLAQVLSQSGCERVRVLQGGFPAWVQAGLPTERGR
jgi:rhodanese-related sulfurtransferase